MEEKNRNKVEFVAGDRKVVHRPKDKPCLFVIEAGAWKFLRQSGEEGLSQAVSITYHKLDENGISIGSPKRISIRLQDWEEFVTAIAQFQNQKK